MHLKADSFWSDEHVLPIAQDKILVQDRYLTKYYSGHKLTNKVFARYENSTHPAFTIDQDIILMNQDEGFSIWNARDTFDNYIENLPPKY